MQKQRVIDKVGVRVFVGWGKKKKEKGVEKDEDDDKEQKKSDIHTLIISSSYRNLYLLCVKHVVVPINCITASKIKKKTYDNISINSIASKVNTDNSKRE